MPESTIRVLRDDCSYAENLVGDLGEGFVLKEKLHFFFRRRDIVEKKESNPRRSSLSQKFSFCASFFKWRQNLLLYHMYHFEVDDENKVDQSLIFSSFRSRYQHFAGQNDQLRLKSSKAALKAFQMIFPWLKMK